MFEFCPNISRGEIYQRKCRHQPPAQTFLRAVIQGHTYMQTNTHNTHLYKLQVRSGKGKDTWNAAKTIKIRQGIGLTFYQKID